MGYCDGTCEHLTSRHNCKKYKKGLAYSSYSSRSISTGAVHERCSECDKDYWIAELEGQKKKIQELVDYMVEVSERLCPDEEPDHLEDGEEVFEHGRGQGIFEICMEVKRIVNPQLN